MCLLTFIYPIIGQALAAQRAPSLRAPQLYIIQTTARLAPKFHLYRRLVCSSAFDLLLATFRLIAMDYCCIDDFLSLEGEGCTRFYHQKRTVVWQKEMFPKKFNFLPRMASAGIAKRR
jgi:hypothetical protein